MQTNTEDRVIMLPENVVCWDVTIKIGKYGSRSKGGFKTAGAAWLDAQNYISREPGNVTGIEITPVYRKPGEQIAASADDAARIDKDTWDFVAESLRRRGERAA